MDSAISVLSLQEAAILTVLLDQDITQLVFSVITAVHAAETLILVVPTLLLFCHNTVWLMLLISSQWLQLQCQDL
jgi:hypothetical protein